MHLVVALGAPASLAAAVARCYPDRWREVTGSSWLVASRATSDEVWARLLAEVETASGLVMEVSTYWGLGPTETWDWMHKHRND